MKGLRLFFMALSLMLVPALAPALTQTAYSADAGPSGDSSTRGADMNSESSGSSATRGDNIHDWGQEKGKVEQAPSESATSRGETSSDQSMRGTTGTTKDQETTAGAKAEKKKKNKHHKKKKTTTKKESTSETTSGGGATRGGETDMGTSGSTNGGTTSSSPSESTPKSKSGGY